MLKVAFGTVGVLAMAVLAGCAGTPAGSGVEAVAPSAPAVQYTFQDPDDVPQERWSEAMRIARAMGIEGGLKDVVAPEGVSVTPQGEAVMASQGVDPLVGGVLGAASPTTHVSSGASLALGAAFFVLGNAKQTAPYMHDIVAFWVPVSMASSAEEASAVAEETWFNARVSAFATKRYSKPRAMKYPAGHRHYRGETMAEILSNSQYGATPYSGAPQTVELGSMSGEYYGPIFIMDAGLQNGHDRRDSSLKHLEYYEVLAENMPSWSAMYFPAKRNRKMEVIAPPVVIHDGNVMGFTIPAE